MNISNNAGIDSNDLAKRGESLIRKSTNRYLTTVKIAFRAKQRRFDDFDGLLEESTVKPVQRSIIELIGIDHRSIELKKSEFESLYFLLLRINKQLIGIKNELMDEESIALVIEQLPWFIELEGDKYEWSLRFVFESQDETRSFEMYWPIPIAQTLFYEIKNMWESMN